MLYNIVSLAGVVLGFPLIAAKILGSEKRWQTVKRRVKTEGLAATAAKRPLWVHAVSVGEVLASAPLIRAIRNDQPGLPIVLSVSTLTGHAVATKLLSMAAMCIFFSPFDFIWSVRTTIRRVRPALFVLVESDTWPNLVFEMKRHQIPFTLVSARMSPGSFRGYTRFSLFMKQVFSRMACICAQTESDARRFIALGAPPKRVFVTGNIKFDQAVDLPSEDELKHLRASLRIKPKAGVFVAGSTHHGEEEILSRVFRSLKQDLPELMLVLAPRDPARAARIKHLFQETGLVTALRTEVNHLSQGVIPDVVVVDTMGELRRLYALADVVFVGKSLLDLGGQNPLEPAALGKPILFGPHMFNFELIARTLVRQGGAVEVAGEAELLETAKGLLKNPTRCEMMGRKARDVFVANRGAVQNTLHVLERFFLP